MQALNPSRPLSSAPLHRHPSSGAAAVDMDNFRSSYRSHGRLPGHARGCRIISSSSLSSSSSNSHAVVPSMYCSATATTYGAKPGWRWGMKDPEMKRRKRVAMYKAYAAEGKLKASLRKGVRWVKTKCTHIVHGYY